ncbi:MAG: DUF6588 family protein [Candidatus Latescibacterota bacterium]
MRVLRLPRSGAVCLLAAGLLCAAAPGWAQSDLENVLRQYGEETVKGYVRPLVDVFSANLHAGLYHSASLGGLKPQCELSIVAMGSLVGDGQESYTARAPEGFQPATFRTATVFGGRGTQITHAANPGLKYRGSDGIIEATLFPLAVPQLAVSYLGTEALVRFMRTPNLGDDAFPETTLFGLGLRHSISRYIPAAPVDVAAGVFYNAFTMGDIVDFRGLALGVQASRGFGPLSAYGGVAWEQGTMNLQYATDNPYSRERVDVDIDGDNSFRLTLGGRLSLALLRLFADVNVGAVTNFSSGIGLGS